MTEPGIPRVSILDEPWRRLPLALVLSLVIWCGLFIVLGFFLERAQSPPPPAQELEARIIELPAIGLAGGGGGDPSVNGASPSAKTAQAPARAEYKPENKPKTSRPARSHRVEPITKKVVPPNDQGETEPTFPITDAKSSKPSSSPDVQSNSTAVKADAAGAAGQEGSGKGSGVGAGAGVGEGSGRGAGGGFGTGGSGPEAIYAPVPSIPDDMRDEVLEAIAVARFRVSHDGRSVVSLSKPTEFSRLNAIILETLRQWRFHPASRNGVAIDSDAEVRLLITVR